MREKRGHWRTDQSQLGAALRAPAGWMGRRLRGTAVPAFFPDFPRVADGCRATPGQRSSRSPSIPCLDGPGFRQLSDLSLQTKVGSRHAKGAQPRDGHLASHSCLRAFAFVASAETRFFFDLRFLILFWPLPPCHSALGSNLTSPGRPSLATPSVSVHQVFSVTSP